MLLAGGQISDCFMQQIQKWPKMEQNCTLNTCAQKLQASRCSTQSIMRLCIYNWLATFTLCRLHSWKPHTSIGSADSTGVILQLGVFLLLNNANHSSTWNTATLGFEISNIHVYRISLKYHRTSNYRRQWNKTAHFGGWVPVNTVLPHGKGSSKFQVHRMQTRSGATSQAILWMTTNSKYK